MPADRLAGILWAGTEWRIGAAPEGEHYENRNIENTENKCFLIFKDKQTVVGKQTLLPGFFSGSFFIVCLSFT